MNKSNCKRNFSYTVLSDNFLLISFLYNCIFNIFAFWTVCLIKQFGDIILGSVNRQLTFL